MQPQPKKNTALIGLIAIVVLAALVVGTIALQPKKDSSQNSDTNTSTNTPSSDTEASSPSSANGQESGVYKDGTYKATGSYVSPGGNEEIDVTITIADGKITDSSVAPQAATRESLEYQDEFVNGYKEQVTGKDLATLMLGKVSGSSLTSRGFNEALDQIRSQAKI